MSFLHVLSQIGVGALKVAQVAGGAVGGPAGFGITTLAGVLSEELTPKPGAAKAAAVMSVAQSSPALAASPLPPDARAAHILQFINAVVAALNAIAALFPSPAAPPPAA